MYATMSIIPTITRIIEMIENTFANMVSKSPKQEHALETLIIAQATLSGAEFS